jgi:hypothetical protein
MERTSAANCLHFGRSPGRGSLKADERPYLSRHIAAELDSACHGILLFSVPSRIRRTGEAARNDLRRGSSASNEFASVRISASARLRCVSADLSFFRCRCRSQAVAWIRQAVTGVSPLSEMARPCLIFCLSPKF